MNEWACINCGGPLKLDPLTLKRFCPVCKEKNDEPEEDDVGSRSETGNKTEG